MKRRDFLKLGAASTAAALTTGPASLVSSFLDASMAGLGPRQLEELSEMTSQLGSWYWRMSPGSILPILTGHQSALLGKLRSGSGWASRELQLLAAECSVMAGLAAYRLDDHVSARRHLELGEHLAREANDGPTLATVLAAARALVSPAAAGGGGSGAVQAIQMLDHALQLAGSDARPLVRTWVLCSRAVEAATLGRDRDVLRDLDTADSALALAGEPARGFFDHWDQTRVDGWRASALLHLGRFEEAAAILESVVEATPIALGGPRTAVVADLGAAYILAGQPEHGVELLVGALTAAREAGALDGVIRVQRIRRRHLERFGGMASVRQLDEMLGGGFELPR